MKGLSRDCRDPSRYPAGAIAEDVALQDHAGVGQVLEYFRDKKMWRVGFFQEDSDALRSDTEIDAERLSEGLQKAREGKKRCALLASQDDAKRCRTMKHTLN